jgi:hypothetical protein
MKAPPKITEDANDKNIAVLLKRLDIERHAKGELVMYPGTDMRWYAITVAVAGLLNREREIAQIEAVLLEAEIRPEVGGIVAAVKRLADRRYGPN